MTLGIVATFVYGILAILGGAIGYHKASSQVSIISGSISGLLLVFAAVVQLQGHTWGLILAAIVTAILIVFFAFRLAKTRKFMPAGLMAILGIVALAMIVNSLIAR